MGETKSKPMAGSHPRGSTLKGLKKMSRGGMRPKTRVLSHSGTQLKFKVQKFRNMKKIHSLKLYAPQIDAIIERFNPKDDFITPEIYLKMKDIYGIFGCIKSRGDDRIRQIWIEVERGPIEAFGDYEESRKDGDVESPEEFEQMWKDYYPEETKWYEFATSEYKNEKFFFINDKLFFTIKDEEPQPGNKSFHSEQFEQFVTWLRERIIKETDKLRQDPVAFNSYIRQNLSWTKRFGKIIRKEYWDILDVDAVRLDRNLGEETIDKLKMLIEGVKSESAVYREEMTAGMFFSICEICYNANGYFKKVEKQLSPREKYLNMADGRDAGLRNIDPDSPEAFYDWYHSGGTLGAHPWEICRGGNSTHISLYVSEAQGKWNITLAGSSVGRVEETVRMVVALSDNKIPFELRDANEIVRMVTGIDFIGIVPDNIFPSYCHTFFPKEDKIIDFMNLDYDKEISLKTIEKAFWYPLDDIILI